jgi:hypothetical protein
MIDYFVAMLVAGILQSTAQTPQPSAGVQAPPSTSTATANRTQSDDERVVCRRERMMGSNRSERVCMTVGQRNALRQSTRDQLDRLDRGVNRGEASTGAPTISPGGGV